MPDPHVEIVPDQTQRTALLQAHHISMRRHAQSKIYQARAHAEKAGLTAAEFCVVVIDTEDPSMDDANYERLGGYGYRVTLMRHEEMKTFLRAFEMPVEEARLRWSHAARCWVNSDGKKVSDYAKQRPFLPLVRKVEKPAQENFFLVVTFTQGAVMFVDLPDVEVPLEEGDVPLVRTDAVIEAAQEALEAEASALPADGSGGLA